MPLIHWRSAYATNVVLIDRDHKHLVELINNLHEARTSGRTEKVLQRLLADMIDYTHSHFAREHELMTAHAYPEIDRHLEAHRQLLEGVLQLQQRLQADDPQLGTDLFRFLREWLLEHIVETDHKFGAYLNERGVY